MRHQKDSGRIRAIVLCDDCYIGITQGRLRDLFRQFGGQDDGLKTKPASKRAATARLLGESDKFERLLTPTRRARASDLVYTEHFQPVGVLLGFVSDQVGCLDHPLWLVPIGEIDDPRALGAEHV